MRTVKERLISQSFSRDEILRPYLDAAILSKSRFTDGRPAPTAEVDPGLRRKAR